ncbi:MAG: hypothetical protein A2184_01275 [Candidatus Moranbacteria bacterium RIFOXYA1_FULL_44_7]|nr:MAG: hypothetical protein A2184_01275 [Candidatus Moranbacteria bacterium RIFOXYA1_FULL_44_7]
MAGAALQEKKINLEEKKKIVASIFGKYVSEGEALNLAEQCREKANIENTSEITLDELIEFNSATERTLSSYIGAPAANVAVSEEKLISEEETEHLSALYAQKAAELKLTPKELHEKIDYYAEKEELLKKQSAELEKIVKERTKNLEEKNKELENSKKAMLNLLEDFKEAQEKERLAHESVALQKERAESILNYLQSIAEAVFATDVSENIVFINRTAKSLLPKETRDQVELQKAQDTFQFVEEEGNKKKPVYPVMSSLEHSSSFKFPKNSYLRTGQKDIPIDGICSPFAKGGKNLGAICVFQDITERHNLEKEKDDFLSIAAHQLRTPLSGIRWMIESLLEGDDGELPTEAQKTLDQIYENNQRLIVLINDLLDVSKINMGKSKEDPISVNICEKLKDAAESMAGLAKERHVSISYEKICALNPIVEIGPRHFFQVLQNLISNAVKYTPKEGSVKVSVDFKENKVTISVSDTGIGIPKDEQDKIFKKFFRASNAALKETEGSGLGLSVVKSYIEEAGGRIWFESRERKGTTFFVELPVAKAS